MQVDRSLRFEHVDARSVYPRDQRRIPSTVDMRLTRLASRPHVCRPLLHYVVSIGGRESPLGCSADICRSVARARRPGIFLFGEVGNGVASAASSVLLPPEPSLLAVWLDGAAGGSAGVVRLWRLGWCWRGRLGWRWRLVAGS